MTTLTATSSQNLGADLRNAEYVRQRICPRPSDKFYLALSDLLLAVKRLETAEKLVVLDYGAGGSPYRSLFSNSDYRQADAFSSPDSDYVITPEGTVPEHASVFDLILSTQVLEHVEYPSVYLSECFRLLKPGGNLLLTTHGSFEDHACPYDFQRWTADGLRRDLEFAGFEVRVLQKLTTGPRAVMFMIERYLDTTSFSRRTLFGFIGWMCRKLLPRSRYWLHSRLDCFGESCRVVPADRPNSNLYLGLLAYAHRS
jgi:SAM-dependent methyltransferase